MSENKSVKNNSSKRDSHENHRNVLLKQLAKPFGFLLLFIMVCAFLARYLTDSETLTEYARNNPELAYGTGKAAQTSSPSQDSAPQINTETVLRSADQTDAADTPGNDTVSSDTSSADAADTPKTSSIDASDTPAASSIDTSDTPAASSTYTTDKSTVTESDKLHNNPERTTYQPGFYYEPLTDTVKQRITGISYPESGCTVPYEDLHYVGLLYRDFNGEEQTGELICNKAIAQDMVEIFYELYRNDYQIERVRLIDEYDGDDTASMADNNTSCFNYRVVDGTTNLSKHAYGLAIDINPFYNPYVVFHKGGTGNTYISPAGSEIYADRSQEFPYKIDENDLCYRLFTEHGFTWGGNWNSSKDYQHFQKVLN